MKNENMSKGIENMPNGFENMSGHSQDSLVLDTHGDPATALTAQVLALIPPIPHYDPALVAEMVVGRRVDAPNREAAMDGYKEFFTEIPEEHAGGGPPGGGPLSDNLKAFWGGVYLTHIKPTFDNVKKIPENLLDAIQDQIIKTIESIKDAEPQQRFLFVIKLLQILVICSTNYKLITQIITTIAKGVAAASDGVVDAMIPLVLPIMYYASYYAGVKKFGKAIISLRLIVYELIFGSQMQGTITVGSYILYKYLDKKYGAELAQVSQGARDTIEGALLAKKQEIKDRIQSMIDTKIAPAIDALAFFYQSHDEFIMLLGSNIIETVNEMAQYINHAREIYNYYVAIGRSRSSQDSNEMGNTDEMDNPDEMFRQGVAVVNAGLSDAGIPIVDVDTIQNVVDAAGAHNAAGPAAAPHDISTRPTKRARSAGHQNTAGPAISEGGKRRIKRKHKKTHKKSHKKHHKRKTTRRKMIKVRKTKARKSKLHKKKSGKHTKKHRKH